jgi:hypothetical protein
MLQARMGTETQSEESGGVQEVEEKEVRAQEGCGMLNNSEAGDELSPSTVQPTSRIVDEGDNNDFDFVMAQQQTQAVCFTTHAFCMFHFSCDDLVAFHDLLALAVRSIEREPCCRHTNQKRLLSRNQLLSAAQRPFGQLDSQKAGVSLLHTVCQYLVCRVSWFMGCNGWPFNRQAFMSKLLTVKLLTVKLLRKPETGKLRSSQAPP